MSKVKTLALAALLLGLVGVARATPTRFKDLAVTGDLTVTGKTTLGPKTLAQINALTSGTTGQMIIVSDGVMTKVCVSSGTTAPGQWTVTQGTAAAVAPLHCQ